MSISSEVFDNKCERGQLEAHSINRISTLYAHTMRNKQRVIQTHTASVETGHVWRKKWIRCRQRCHTLLASDDICDASTKFNRLDGNGETTQPAFFFTQPQARWLNTSAKDHNDTHQIRAGQGVRDEQDGLGWRPSLPAAITIVVRCASTTDRKYFT